MPLPAAVTCSKVITGAVTGEASYVLHSVTERFNGKSPGIIACHGASANGFFCDPLSGPANHAYMSALAAKGYICISSNWGGDLYGNATGTAALGEAYTWLGANGAKVGKVGLYGLSAGAATAMNFWNADQAKVGACAFIVPAFNLTNLYADNASLQAGMDAAYSGSYATNGTGNSPHAFAAALTDVPTLVWYASDDTVVRSADVAATATALGTTATDIGPGGHAALVNGVGDFKALVSVMEGLR